MSVQFFPSMSNAEYHASDALSSSGLKWLAKSPAHFWNYRRNPPEQTKSMKLGQYLHTALELGFESFLEAPTNDTRTKLFKEFAFENSTRTVLGPEDYYLVQGMYSAIKSHPTASKLLQNGVKESSLFWTDEETGVKCRCRPDYLRDDGIIVDLKTSIDASESGFQSSIYKYKYHWQSAWYCEGVGILQGKPTENFIHLVVENTPPFGIGIYCLDNGSLDKAMHDIRILRRKYADCLSKGRFNSYPHEIRNIGIPHWAFNLEVE